MRHLPQRAIYRTTQEVNSIIQRNALRFALLLLPLLVGCASTGYRRYIADDAVLLRVSQSGFRTIYGNFTTYATAGNRKRIFFTGQLNDYGDAVTLKTQSREDMLDAPPPEEMDVVELSVRPGRYTVTFFHNLFDEIQCTLHSEDRNFNGSFRCRCSVSRSVGVRCVAGWI